MRTIQSQYRPFEKMSMGTAPYGAKVHAEFEILPGVRYALIESRHFRTYPRIKTEIEYSVQRFAYVDGLWEDTSFLRCKNKAEAKKMFKALSAGAKP